MTVSCPRCGGAVRGPDPDSSGWECSTCGPIAPLHTAERLGLDVIEAVSARVTATEDAMPLWCPWPLPADWLVTGVAWAGDERTGVQASAIACSGPAPLVGGPADIVVVAEEPGVGLGNRLAGLAGTDPGVAAASLAGSTAHARVKAARRDTPMWTVGDRADRAAFVGEARGRWLYVVAWPAETGYVLSEDVSLHDLTEWMPADLEFGRRSPYLDGPAALS